MAKQQARRRSKKTKTGGLSDAGAGASAGTGTGRSEVIDMAASRDDDDRGTDDVDHPHVDHHDDPA